MPGPLNSNARLIPDFRNLGTLLRVLLVAECAKFGHLLGNHGDLLNAVLFMGQSSPQYETSLLCTVLILFVAAPWLQGQTFKAFSWIAVTLSILVANGVHLMLFRVGKVFSLSETIGTTLLASAITAAVIFYLHWRQLALSPALAEAKLSALQARIRPHFLFNSLNTVISLIRPDPKRAEAVLENLADLFRALLADPNTLVALSRELELARAYADVETLRLGDRLRLVWHTESAPLLASVPQLILQPLLENAVIHGIEPAPEGGEVHVNLFEKNGRLVIVVRNPLLSSPAQREGGLVRNRSGNRTGNHMALNNIRERLDLHFDAEARMTHFTAGGEFVVQIEIPLHNAATSTATCHSSTGN